MKKLLVSILSALMLFGLLIPISAEEMFITAGDLPIGSKLIFGSAIAIIRNYILKQIEAYRGLL